MKIRLIGIRNTLGIGVHFSNFADALRRVAGIGDCVEEIDSTSEPAMLTAAAQSQQDDINICFVSIDLQPFFRGTNIQWVVFESTRVPEIVMNTMIKADVVWVPSTWGRSTLITNGIDPARCDIVPEGVDTDRYHPYLTGNADKVTRFLTVGKFEERKSYKEILLAWASVFANEPSVELVIKTDHFVNVEHKQKNLNEFLNQLNLTNVHPVWNKVDLDQMSQLYRSSDVFLLPSKGEGWGLPLIEAAAQGLPIITTMYSGQAEYLQHIKTSVIPVEFDLGEITCPEFRYFYPTNDGNWGTWAMPRVESIAQALSFAQNNLPRLKQQALINADTTRRLYSWPACVDHVLKNLQQRGLLKV
jgi:glycosyltransferase involved in cell wall biosynthesis